MSISEPDFFSVGLDDPSKRKCYEPDREDVRRELTEILETAKTAIDDCPWDKRAFQYHKVVFPQMANWLPPKERDQMRSEFKQEVERIEHLMTGGSVITANN